MKKKLLITLLTVTVLCLGGCGGNTADTETSNTNADTAEVQEDTAEETSGEESNETSETNTDDNDVETVEETAEDKEETQPETVPVFDETAVATIELTSEDLHDGVWDSAITNTDNGSNTSPKLSWEPVEGADSYVIYMVDNTANCWMHWMAKDVKETYLARGFAVNTEYVGPYPPSGTHEYQIYVIALKNPVSEIYGDFDKANLFFDKNKYNCDVTDDGEAGNILAIGTITGTYTAGE